MLSQIPFECPPDLLTRAAGHGPVRTAVVGAGDALALESARLAFDHGLIAPLLVGPADAIEQAATSIGWDISSFEQIAVVGEIESAKAGAALARDGRADVLMKGHVHTDAFVLGILDRQSDLRIGRRLTHVFHMTVPGSDKVLLITDAAVNVAPDIETRLQALEHAVELAHALGIAQPKVAVLSGTEQASEKMPSSMEAVEITRLAENRVPGALVFGPLAFDNAVSEAAARLKGIDHPVAGHADILLVPNIECGNAMFKMMVYFQSACAAGIVMGAKVPAILTSRADPPEARLASAALAVILVGIEK